MRRHNYRHNEIIGVTVPDVFSYIFIVLKCVGVIDWSWWWVLSPWWIATLFLIIVYGITYLVEYVKRR